MKVRKALTLDETLKQTKKQAKMSHVRCCAFLSTRPNELCKCAGKEEVAGIVYCGKHVAKEKRAHDNKERDFIASLAKFKKPTNPNIHVSECAVCFDEFGEESDDRMFLECGHAFHMGCVGPWFARDNKTCPCCRAESVRGRVEKDAGDEMVRKWLRLLTAHGRHNEYSVTLRDYAESLRATLSLLRTKEARDAFVVRQLAEEAEVQARHDEAERRVRETAAAMGLLWLD